MKSILLIAPGYPTKDDPEYAFIQPLARAVVDTGIECSVIVPQSISRTKVRNKKKRPYKWIDQTAKGNIITIYQPTYISTSNIIIHNTKVSAYLQNKAIIRCYHKEKINAEIIYAHFWECGIPAAQIAKEINVPVVVATGESVIPVFDYFNDKTIKNMLSEVKGVISVSRKNLIESQKLGLLKDEMKSAVITNGYNLIEKKKKKKEEARKKLNLDSDAFIGAFVGEFCERKGDQRVVEAVKAMPYVKLIMAGKGTYKPQGEQILFCKELSHNKLVHLLNAADFFVLPTLAEGCCNAIVEAMACGLPIVSSNLSFNDDILSEDNSVRIDPNDIGQIRDAIKLLYDNKELAEKLSKG